MARYRWNEPAGSFVDSRGRFVSPARVRAVVDDIADAASERMAQASSRLLNGEMSLGAWQAEGEQIIKNVILAGGAIGNGGAAQLTFSEFGYLGQQIRQQYDYLRSFAADISSGRQPLNAGLISRARMYGQQGRVIFEKVRARDAAGRGLTEEKNVLHPAEHCQECRSLAALGWVPLGTLPSIGSRQCRSNDRCSITRRSAAEAAA